MSTFNVGDVDVELGELLTRALHALVHRLQDLFGVLLHPPGTAATNQISRLISDQPADEGSAHSPFLWEALLDLHLVMAEELGRFRIKHLQKMEK